MYKGLDLFHFLLPDFAEFVNFELLCTVRLHSVSFIVVHSMFNSVRSPSYRELWGSCKLKTLPRLLQSASCRYPWTICQIVLPILVLSNRSTELQNGLEPRNLVCPPKLHGLPCMHTFVDTVLPAVPADRLYILQGCLSSIIFVFHL